MTCSYKTSQYISMVATHLVICLFHAQPSSIQTSPLVRLITENYSVTLQLHLLHFIIRQIYLKTLFLLTVCILNKSGLLDQMAHIVYISILLNIYFLIRYYYSNYILDI